jgi:hypothetical protein
MGIFTVIPDHLLSREDAALGRLTVDPANPERTFRRSANLHLQSDDITTKS